MRAKVVVPSVVAAGEKFAVRMEIQGAIRELPDGEYNVGLYQQVYKDRTAADFRGTMIVSADESSGFSPVEHEFSSDDAGLYNFEGVSFSQPGIYWLRARSDDLRVCGESNPIQVESAAPELRIFWGDIHQHSIFSDGLRSPEENSLFARNVSFLDLFALTDHDTLGGARQLSPEQWEQIQEQTRKFNQPGRFVTLLGYEWTNFPSVKSDTYYGHRNVYFAGDTAPLFSSGHPESDTPEKLWAKLQGHDAITIPHHPAARPFPGNWDYGGNSREPLVEIYSVWGNSEMLASKMPASQGNPRPVQFGGLEVAGSHVQDALARGYRYGFTASSDGHDGRPGESLDRERTQTGPGDRRPVGLELLYPQGLMAVSAKELSREAIWQAMLARRTYATTGPRIILDFRVNDHLMGEEFAADSPQMPRQVWVQAVGTRAIARIEIVKNGAVLCAEGFSEPVAELEFVDQSPITGTDYYYARITQADGEYAWSSPVWCDAPTSKQGVTTRP